MASASVIFLSIIPFFNPTTPSLDKLCTSISEPSKSIEIVPGVKVIEFAYITFAKFHGDFIFDLYNQTKINPSDIIYIDRLLKNHLINITKNKDKDI